MCRVFTTLTPLLATLLPARQRIANERTGSIEFGVTLYRARTGPIDPADYETFEAFNEAVDTAWRDAWRRAHELRASSESRMGTATGEYLLF